MTRIVNSNLIQTVTNKPYVVVDFTSSGIWKTSIFRHIFYPAGKSVAHHLLRYQGLVVKNYDFALDALDLKYHRLLQR